jgi:hypothetical protein
MVVGKNKKETERNIRIKRERQYLVLEKAKERRKL